MSLLDTYDLVDKAEKLVSQQRLKEAAQLYAEASKSFKRLVNESDSREIQEALTILSGQHAKRSEELIFLLKNKTQLPTPQRIPSSPLLSKPSTLSISSSLASARGQSTQMPSSPVITNLSDTAVLYGDDLTSNGDPVTRFQVAVYNLIRAPNLTSTTGEMTMVTKPVKPSGKSVEELELENATLKQLLSTYSENLHAYESLHKKVKQSLKTYLSTLKRELVQQEQGRKQEYEAKIDHLYRENKKLEQQNNKLEQRWNKLVESAKKRRGVTDKD